MEAGAPLGREAQPEGGPLPHWPRPHGDQCLNAGSWREACRWVGKRACSQLESDWMAQKVEASSGRLPAGW